MGITLARSSYYFTSESVSEGHPDKVCDRISDEIVDLVYKEARKTGTDPRAIRVAAETLATTNRVIIAGEVRVPPSLIKKNKHGEDVINPSRFKSAAKKAIKSIGYDQNGFSWSTAKIDVLLHFQSADIAQGVDNAADQQGAEGCGQGLPCKQHAAEYVVRKIYGQDNGQGSDQQHHPAGSRHAVPSGFGARVAQVVADAGGGDQQLAVGRGHDGREHGGDDHGAGSQG